MPCLEPGDPPWDRDAGAPWAAHSSSGLNFSRNSFSPSNRGASPRSSLSSIACNTSASTGYSTALEFRLGQADGVRGVLLPAWTAATPLDGFDKSAWRALHALLPSAVAAGVDAVPGIAGVPVPAHVAAAEALVLLRWLAGGERGGAPPPAAPWVDSVSALLPRLGQELHDDDPGEVYPYLRGEGPRCRPEAIAKLVCDPFRLLLDLMASFSILLSAGDPAPTAVLAALLPPVCGLAALQAAVLAVQSLHLGGRARAGGWPALQQLERRERAQGGPSPVQASAAAAAVAAYLAAADDPAAAEAVDAALGACMAPLLHRCVLLADLVAGAPPRAQGESAAAALRALGLPPPLALLQRHVAGLDCPLSAIERSAPFPGLSSKALPQTAHIDIWAEEGLAGLRSPPGTETRVPLPGGRPGAPGTLVLASPPPPAAPGWVSLSPQYHSWYLGFLKHNPCTICSRAVGDPALCLRCGAVVCCHDPACGHSDAAWGACYTHAACCGAGTGAFLLLQSTRVLLLRQGRVTFAPSLYLDAYGEEDPGLRCGKPLYLSAARVAAAERLWRAAAFDLDSSTLHGANRGGARGEDF